MMQSSPIGYEIKTAKRPGRWTHVLDSPAAKAAGSCGWQGVRAREIRVGIAGYSKTAAW